MKYKYLGSDEYSLKPVTEGTIKYSLITDLNDPFEVSSIPDPNYADEVHTMSVDNLGGKTVREIMHSGKKRIQDLLQPVLDATTSDHDRDLILNTPMKDLLAIDHPNKEKFGQNIDPNNHHNMESSRQRKQQFIFDDQFAILCLSSVPSSYLMWSHYAQKHEGFCIGFDELDPWFRPLDDVCEKLEIPDSKKPLGSEYFANLIEVKYYDKRPTFSDNQDLSDILPPFFWKSKDWEYEAEYRMLYPLNLAQELPHLGKFNEKSIDPIKSLFKVNKDLYIRAFDRKIIKEIIFGCKCSIKTQTSIRQALKGYNVSYKFAIPSSVDYSMKIKDSFLDYPHDPFSEEAHFAEVKKAYLPPEK